MALVDIWITGGQSNMQGQGAAVDAPETDPDMHWEWRGAGPLVQLDEPGGDGEYQPYYASCLPAFAIGMTQVTGRPLVVVRCAVGGTSLLASNATEQGTWDVGGTRFPNAIARAQGCIATVESEGHTVNSVNVLWHQGERDADGQNNLDQYQAAYQALVGRFRTALSRPDLKVYALRVGRRSQLDGSEPPARAPYWQQVRDAQVAACDAQEGLFMVYLRCKDFPDLGWQKVDGLHYNQNGLNDMGYGAAVGVANAEDLPPPPPPEPLPSQTSIIAHLLKLAPSVLPATLTYTNPGAFQITAPSTATSMLVECVGGGGGAGGGNALSRGAGGGGAAYASATVSTTAGATYDIVVGAAGTPGRQSDATLATAGGVSSFKLGTTTLVAADSGKGGANATGAAGTGGTVAASTGTTRTAGTAGQTAVSGGAGGAAAPPLGGAGGAGNVASDTAGNPGVAPGGGGSGSGTQAAQLLYGGAGAAGLVKITFTYA